MPFVENKEEAAIAPGTTLTITIPPSDQPRAVTATAYGGGADVRVTLTSTATGRAFVAEGKAHATATHVFRLDAGFEGRANARVDGPAKAYILALGVAATADGAA